MAKNRKKLSGGMTLIEILVVIGILAIVAGFSLATNLDSFRGYSFRDERDTLVNNLQRVRGMSINNICKGVCGLGGLPHGIHFENGKYTLFQGGAYVVSEPANEVVEIKPAIQIAGLTDVIFTQLSGNATVNPVGVWNITVTDNANHTSIITINSEGRITWTN